MNNTARIIGRATQGTGSRIIGNGQARQTSANTVVKDASGAIVGTDNTDEVGVVDASFAYQFNDNLKFTFDALNLTDEAETTLVGDYDLVDTALKSGRQFYLGAQYSF